jgi:hypothetical protein
MPQLLTPKKENVNIREECNLQNTYKKQKHSYQERNLPFLQFFQASLTMGRSISHQHPSDSAESFALQSLCES